MIAKIILGMWPLSGDFGPVSLALTEEILTYAYKRGIRHFDVAPNYGNGFAEFALGMIFRGEETINIYTKCGSHPFSGKDYSSQALENSLEQSFARLKCKKIKGIFLHNPRSECIDYPSIFHFFDRLKYNGSIDLAGISGAKGFNYHGKIDRKIDIYQQDANLLFMDELKSRTANSKLFFARSPLGSGILSGHMTEKTCFNDDDHRSLWLKGERLLSLLRRVDVIKSYIGKENLPSIARRYLLYHNKVDFSNRH